MISSRAGSIAFSVMLVGTPLLSAQADSTTEVLRSTVAQWVETMQKIQEEQSRWSRAKQVLQSNKEGLEQEVKQLEESIASTKTRLAAAGKDEQDDLEKKQQYDGARDTLAESLAATETRARQIIPLLPEFWLKENTKLGAAVEELKKTEDLSEEEKGKDLGARLNTVVLVLSEAEKFQTRSWVRDEEREVDGKPMLVTTIYFGLATAYSADEGQTIALRGYPTEEGWQFSKLDEQGAPAKVRELIDVASLQGEIDFVEIPMKLQ